jgi:hypothetical protein
MVAGAVAAGLGGASLGTLWVLGQVGQWLNDPWGERDVVDPRRTLLPPVPLVTLRPDPVALQETLAERRN